MRMRMLTGLLMALPLFAAAAGTGAADAALFSAEGYRQDQYRSPTPDTAEGARTLSTEQLKALLGQEPRPVLVDVYRRQWLAGQFIDSEPHANLPGSIWLPNTGDGNLAPEWASYFTRNLQQATGGDKDRALVFYCRSDCWLSWNASMRAHRLGYTDIYWYRDGVDAWEQAGLPLQPARPVPLEATASAAR